MVFVLFFFVVGELLGLATDVVLNTTATPHHDVVNQIDDAELEWENASWFVPFVH